MSNVVPFASSGSTIRGLRSITRSGTPYNRNEEVEAQIQGVMAASYLTWPATVDDGLEGQRIKNETLVYLIRDCFNHDRDDVLLQLHERLFERMAMIVKRRGARMGLKECGPLAEYVHDRIIERLYSNQAFPASEFLEVAFGRAVAVEVFKWNRRYGEYWRRIEVDAESFENLKDDAIVQQSSTTLEELEQRLTIEQIVQNAKKFLAPPHFEAFYLHYVKGLPVERNGSSASLEEHFRKSPSTIYLWLRRSVKLISNNLNRRPGDDEEI